MKYSLNLIGLLIFATAIFSSCDLTKLLEAPAATEEKTSDTTSSKNTGKTKVIPSKNLPSKAVEIPGMDPAPSTEEDEVFVIVEEMPRFPGCEHMKANQGVIKQCAENKMKAFIAKHITYPEGAKKEGIEGTAIVKFIVAKDGSINDINLVRDPGSGTGKELVRVVSLMNEMESKWIPGRQRGKTVRVHYTLPFKFSL